MDAAAVLAFTGVAALLTITPGVDMALVARSALSGGRRAALATTWGVVVGCLAWAAASALGVAAVLAASATAYDALRLAGAGYLVWLGIGALRRSGRDPVVPAGGAAPPRRSAFRVGLLTNLANPKIAVFYGAVLPTFVPVAADVLLWSLVLAAIHGLLGLVWLSAYAYALTRARTLFDRPAVRRRVDRLTGGVLVALGLRLAAGR